MFVVELELCLLRMKESICVKNNRRSLSDQVMSMALLSELVIYFFVIIYLIHMT